MDPLFHVPHPQLPLVPMQVTPFHSSRPPAITVKSYLEDRYALVAFLSLDADAFKAQIDISSCCARAFANCRACSWRCQRMCFLCTDVPVTRMYRILKYAGCSEETFILALIYMDQVRRSSPLDSLRQSRIHLVLGCSVSSQPLL